MQPHQQRVIDEQVELENKLNRLHDFIGGDVYRSLALHEQDRLFWQAIHMREYNDVLKERIAAF